MEGLDHLGEKEIRVPHGRCHPQPLPAECPKIHREPDHLLKFEITSLDFRMQRDGVPSGLDATGLAGKKLQFVFLFEIADESADGGLGDTEDLTGLGHVSGFDHCAESFDLSQIEPQHSIPSYQFSL